MVLRAIALDRRSLPSVPGRTGVTLSGPAGYSGTPLPKKLGIREGNRLAIVNAPEDFLSDTLVGLPDDVDLVGSRHQNVDVCLLFSEQLGHLRKLFPVARKRLRSDGAIWVCWPKKSSGVKTDLSFDAVQQCGLGNGMVDVKICAVDSTWSGLRFVYRLKDR